MKVSDEIRNWREFEDGTECGGFVTKASFDKLCDLADRIDAEMVELPKDADGVPIHVGDTVYTTDGSEAFVASWIRHRSGITMTISELRMTTDGWFVSANGEYITDTTVTHTRPDSFERIADELDEMVDAADSADDRCEKLADLADRIRKLAKKEDER